ncbi:hypothetical protein EBZ39_14175 [bacterium]|nr:hypothetical protein [bacterium]
MDDDNEDDDYTPFEHELTGMQKGLFQLAECFGGPVDGSKLPVPIPEADTIISGYDHETGDMMHYRLVERVDDETGERKFVYQFMECVNTPGMSFDEFMEAVDEYDEEHNADKYEEEDEESN